MFSHEKCLVLQEIINHVSNTIHTVGTTTYYNNEYKMYVNDREGHIYHHTNYIINYTITPEFYRSSLAIVPDIDPWRSVPYFTLKLREGRGTDMIPIQRRYSDTILDVNVSTDIIHDEDEFDSVCFQNSLLYESTDLHGIMLEPFIRNLHVPGSRWQIYDRIFNDDVNLHEVLKLVKERKPHE